MKSTTIQYGLSAPAVSTIIRKPLVNIKGTTSVTFVLSGFEDIFNPAVKLEILWGDTTAKANFFRPLAYNYKTQSILNEVIYGELAGTLFAHYDHVFDNNTSSYNYPLTSQFLVTFKNGKTVYIYQPLNIFKGSFYDDIANLDILNTQITPTSSNNTVINFESGNDQTYIAVLRNGASQMFDNTDYTSTCIPIYTIVTGSTWTGLGSDNNWSTGNNWLQGSAPLSSDNIDFGSAARYAPNNNLTANLPYKGITFNNEAGIYTITGNSFMLYSGGITNNSSNVQTINNNIVLSAGTNILSTNAGAITFNGELSGAGSVSKTGSGTVNVSLARSVFTGSVTVSGGTLKFDNLFSNGGGDLKDLVPSVFNLRGAGATVVLNATAGRIRGRDKTYNFSAFGNQTVNFIGTVLSNNCVFNTSGGPTNYITGYPLEGQFTTVTYDVADGTDDVDLLISSVINRQTTTKLGNGKLSVINIISNITGPITISNGTFDVGGLAGALPNTVNTIVNDGTFSYSSSTNSNCLNYTINGTGNVIKSGTSTLTLSSNNCVYAGSTSILNGTLVSVRGIASAAFTPATLTVTFSSPPTAGQTYQFFTGSTVETYSTVLLIGAIGRSGSYNSTNSTLTIA